MVPPHLADARVDPLIHEYGTPALGSIRYPIPCNGGMTGRVYLAIEPFGLQLPGPFGATVGVGSHLPRLSEAPCWRVLVLIAVV